MNVHLVKWGQVGLCMQTRYFSTAATWGQGEEARGCRQFGGILPLFDQSFSQTVLILSRWQMGELGPAGLREGLAGAGRGGCAGGRGRRRLRFAAGGCGALGPGLTAAEQRGGGGGPAGYGHEAARAAGVRPCARGDWQPVARGGVRGAGGCGGLGAVSARAAVRSPLLLEAPGSFPSSVTH